MMSIYLNKGRENPIDGAKHPFDGADSPFVIKEFCPEPDRAAFDTKVHSKQNAAWY
jgi:hypothetical protein